MIKIKINLKALPNKSNSKKKMSRGTFRDGVYFYESITDDFSKKIQSTNRLIG